MLLLFLTSTSIFSQNAKDYWLEFEEDQSIGSITQTRNSDQTLTIQINNTSLEDFLNNQNLYKIQPAFPNSTRGRLQRTYIITLIPSLDIVSAFMNRPEIANFAVVDNTNVLATTEAYNITLPDDYEDIITGGRNTALDLIKAPLAWKYSTGENVLIGISDSKYDVNHPDLVGKIVHNIQLGNSFTEHGTGVAGIMVANTDNNTGIAGLAYNSQLVAASTNTGSVQLINGLLEVSQYPGVRVVNCSWVLCSSNSITYLEEVVQEVTENGVLIVAAAGNGNGSNCNGNTGYGYPASFDEVIGVSAVGQRFSIGEFHDIENSQGEVFWERSWKDCFNGRPDFGEGERNHNDKINVTAPGQLVIAITDEYNDYPNGVRLNSATSTAAPFVTGLAALIYSANPNLTPSEVKHIIETTADDIYYIPYNESYIGELGTGRINAYRAALTAHCTANPEGGLDLAMQNSFNDDFSEPDVTTPQPWTSQDIWVRNQDDGILIQDHENPEYHSTNPNYIYVRVTNDSCETSDGTDELQVSWAKASTSLSWPSNWDGSLSIQDPVTGASVLMGDEIDTINIPVLEPGETKILKLPWLMPDPDDYNNINNQPWHFCLLARIESSDDPMTQVEDSHITSNVLNNNNIAWKNLTIIDYDPNNFAPADTGGVVRVSNPNPTTTTFDLILEKESGEVGKSIYDEAEVSITMDSTIFQAWDNNGKKSTNITNTKTPNRKIITANNAVLEDITLGGNTHGTVSINFSFLTDELTSKKKYTYHLTQKDAVTGEIIGGETYEIRKKGMHIFQANAGGPITAAKNNPISISATNINEEATYNWYDASGNLIHQGENFEIVPIETQTYKLEVIATKDGFKDYDEVSVSVPPHEITSLSPNPSSNTVEVNYFIQGATSAYLMLVNTTTAATSNYVLNMADETITIDISSYPQGYYEIVLVTDNDIQDGETLLKN